MSTEIDYLIEDIPLPGQKFALISIVGPNLKAKSELYGIKIRGSTNTQEEANELQKKIMKYDSNFDIYTVEVGKFFPIDINPSDIQNVEYSNDQLNNLMKGYHESKEAANEVWHERKNELMKKTITDNNLQKKLSKQDEHPIAVLFRIKETQNNIDDLNKDIDKLKLQLQTSTDKFESYPEESRISATTEFNKSFEL